MSKNCQKLSKDVDSSRKLLKIVKSSQKTSKVVESCQKLSTKTNSCWLKGNSYVLIGGNSRYDLKLLKNA